jgi:hypothetical protein
LKKIIFILLLISLLGFAACSKNKESSEEIIIKYDIYSGFALCENAAKGLTINSTAIAYKKYNCSNDVIFEEVKQIGTAYYNSLLQLFVSKNFMQLENSYVDLSIADAPELKISLIRRLGNKTITVYPYSEENMPQKLAPIARNMVSIMREMDK